MIWHQAEKYNYNPNLVEQKPEINLSQRIIHNNLNMDTYIRRLYMFPMHDRLGIGISFGAESIKKTVITIEI